MKSIIFSTGLRYAALLLLVTDLSGGSPPARAQEAGIRHRERREVQTITVTARKREESLAEVPTSITAFTAETLKDYNIQSFSDYATKTPDLSFTYGGGPTGIADARTIAVRGITGQNLFGTAGATGFYIDDTPVPGSLDPRVVDLASIEVLKGPQGTLYGESSLGGNVRLITRQPDLNKSGFGYMAEAGVTSGGGSPDAGGNFIGNMVLVPGTVALRLVLFANHDAGYMTRTYPTDPNSPGGGNPFLSVPRSQLTATRARSPPAAVRRRFCSMRAIASMSSCASCSRIRRIMGSRRPSRRCRSSSRSTPSTALSTYSPTPPIPGRCRRSTSSTTGIGLQRRLGEQLLLSPHAGRGRLELRHATDPDGPSTS